jgi:hypothetical protein
MKHAYNPECTCKRCVREFHRRSEQSQADSIRASYTRIRRTRANYRTGQPTHRLQLGSQEWAEARGGLIGGYETDDSESGDY